jgi:DNA-binding beta-propeller fold protein YncE
VIFNRNTETGALSHNTSFTDENLLNLYGIAISPDGKNVYVPSYTNDKLVVFSRDDDTEALTLLESHADGTDNVDDLDGAYWVAVSCDGKSIYVTGREEDSLAVFDRNLETGTITYQTCFKDGVDGVDGLNKPLGVTVSSCGGWVYTTGNDDSAVSVFDR